MHEQQRIVHENLLQTVEDIAATTGIRHSTCDLILIQDMKIARTAEKVVPHALTDD